MDGRFFRPPRQVIYRVLLLMPLIVPALAVAQSPSAVSDRAAGPSSADARPGDVNRPGSDILDLEQLTQTPVVVPSMDIPVTSVTKEESTVGRSAAAIFVITNEMIRHSGATCIPDALHMVNYVNSFHDLEVDICSGQFAEIPRGV